MANIKQLQDRLNELIDDLELIRILHAKVVNEIEDAALKIERFDQDLENLRNARPIVETEVGLDVYRRSIGREARIINPKPGEQTIGTIRRVDDFYVHLDFPDGSTKRRSTANLRLRSRE